MLKPRGSLALVTCVLLAACDPDTLEPGPSTSDEHASTSGSTDTGDDPGIPTSTTTTTSSSITTTTEATGESPTDTTAPATTGDTTSGEPMPVECSDLAIADPALLAAIREFPFIPEGPISGEALLKVSSVTATQPVASLAGIECLGSLQHLYLYGSTVTDFGPLHTLSHLRGLQLRTSPIDSLEPFVGLPLVSLLVADAPVADLGPIALMPEMLYLNLQNTAVHDLTPLAGHPALMNVGVDGSHPDSLLPLTTIPTLVNVSLRGCGLDSVADLADATGLEVLKIEDNKLTDLVGLAGMTGLKTLWASNNHIGDLEALSGLTALYDVVLDHNEIVALEPLSGMTSPLRLALQDNHITDLTPLAGVVGVDIMFVDNNPLTGLEGLDSLYLGMLTAANTGLTTLPVLAPESLWYLVLSNNAITDLTPIAGHSVLDTVQLDHNDIVDLGQIADAPWVLAGCAVLDVQANPLDADSVATTLPAMCALDMTATWDQGSCAVEWSVCHEPI